MRNRLSSLVPAVSAALLLGACAGSSSPDGDGTGTSGPSGGVAGEITVLAAASLSDVFETLGRDFERTHPGTRVRLSFGGSSALATQITQGAPADVFASASWTTMEAVIEAGDAASPTPFAANVMEIAVPPSNPAGITELADLARPGVKVALCQVEVPCGAAAEELFGRAGVAVRPVTQESDVKATLAKVRLGEVDAGVVYVTDVLAAGDEVVGVPIPDDVNASTTYPLATLTGSDNPRLARAFAEYVLSDDGRRVLSAAGFRAP